MLCLNTFLQDGFTQNHDCKNHFHLLTLTHSIQGYSK